MANPLPTQQYLQNLYMELQMLMTSKYDVRTDDGKKTQERINAIRDDIVKYSKKLSVEDRKQLDKLTTDFETARQDAIAANEARYEQLVGTKAEQKQLRSYGDIAQDVSQQYLNPALNVGKTAYTDMRYGNSRYSLQKTLPEYQKTGKELLGGYDKGKWVRGRSDALRDEVAGYEPGTSQYAATSLAGRRQASGNALWQAYNETGQQLYGPGGAVKQAQSGFGDVADSYDARTGGIMSGYANRGQDLFGQGGAYDSVRGEQSALRDRVMGYVDDVGTQAREDIGAVYERERASMEQDLINRGLSNTTVAPSLQRGLAESEAQEVRRLDEELGQMRAGYDMDTTGGLTALGQQAAGHQQDWYGGELGSQERGREGWAQLQGQGAELGGESALQQADWYGRKLSEQAAKNEDMMNLGLADVKMGEKALEQLAGWEQQVLPSQMQYGQYLSGLATQYAGQLGSTGAAMSGLWGQPLQTIQAREDIGPSLSDVANIAMAAGAGQAGWTSMPGMSSLTRYGNAPDPTTDWGSILGGLGMKPSPNPGGGTRWSFQ